MVKRRVILVIVAALLVFLFLNFPSARSSSWRAAFMQLFSPLIGLEHSISRSVIGVRASWVSRRVLARENRELRTKLEDLERENFLLNGLENENRRLRRLLKFSESSALDFIPAKVVGRDTRHWYSSVVINRGRRDGVRPGMAVVGKDGVVGKVIDAGPSISKVLLIIDKQSSVGGVIRRTREMGILKGTSFNTCLLTYLPRQAKARTGDKVVTSGLGGIYPAGLYIGKVERIYEGEYGLYKYADISPGVNFATLEELLVVVEKGPGGEGDIAR